MATLLSIDDYSEEQFKEICKMLTLIPISKEAEAKAKWNFGKSKIPVKQKEHVPMFQIDYIDGKAYLRVPFRFGCGMLKKLVNRDKEFPKVEYNFAGTLRDYQISIVQEAYLQLYSYGSTTLNVYTGAGKTYMSAYLLSQTKSICCVIMSLQTLINSWYNTFVSSFPDLKERIWIVGQGPIPKDVAIMICMDGRVDKIPEDIKRQVGTLIFDEMHLLTTISKVPALLALEPKYIIACSATLERDDGLEVMAHSILGTHGITRLSQKPFKFYKVNTGIKIPEEMGAQGVINYSAFVNTQADDIERNVMAINIISGNPGRKFFLYCKTKKHVDNLSYLCNHYGIEHDTLYGNKKKFLDKNVLIFSVSKTGTGFDLSAALGDAFSGKNPDVLILMTTIKSIPKLKQVLGRVLRSENSHFILLLDSNNVCKKHYRETKGMIVDSKGIIQEIDYDSSVRGGGVVIKDD
jgi:superfamily II DNA or RNA helicase